VSVGSILFEDFQKIDVRVGVVRNVTPFAEGRHSTHILRVDFGPELGVKKSLARLSPNYAGPELVGRQVLCVVNFPPRQIGKHLSEVLTLGVPDAEGNVVLIRPEREVPSGGRLY
jgi:tRNA-binding protein